MADDFKAKPTVQSKDQSNDVASLKAQVERLEALLMQQIQSAPKVSPDTLWAQNHEREKKIRDELERQAALFLEDARKRTQWEANRLYVDGKRLYKVSVGWCPETVIRANDEIAARAYYDHVCGIRGISTNHKEPQSTTYTIVEVTGDSEAQKTVKSEWEFKAAA